VTSLIVNHFLNSFGTNGTLIHQGNVTYMSGIFQNLLPDIMTKLLAAASLGVEGADWKTPHAKTLGIRTVQYSAVDTALKMKNKAQLAKERSERVHVFSIGDAPKKVVDDIVDTDADEHVERYMRREPDSVYTMMVHLSSRSEYFGGVVLIGKDEKDEDWIREHVEEEEEEEDGIFEDYDLTELVTEEEKYIKPEFDAFHTKIQRYTPEQGSTLLIRSESSHGVHKVTRGRLDTLILEFWAYADAPIGTHCQSTKDAKSLLRNEEL
jgi:hypothetical protein